MKQPLVFIDEIDKISRKGDNPSLTRDIKEGTQQSLLKLIEGTEVLVPPQGGRKHPEQKLLKVDTKNILFLCGGSFDGIDKLISKRLNTSVIGFKHGKAGQEIEKGNKEFKESFKELEQIINESKKEKLQENQTTKNKTMELDD